MPSDTVTGDIPGPDYWEVVCRNRSHYWEAVCRTGAFIGKQCAGTNRSLYWEAVIIIIIIIIKKDWQCKAGRGRLPPYQSEDPSRTLPTYRGKEEKGKIVEDKK